MNLMQHPDLVDRLAANYALGTLRHGARRRFEALAIAHPSIAQQCRDWQSRLGGLTELETSVEPPRHVWQKIENLVSAESVKSIIQERPASSWLGKLFAAPGSGWKWGTAAGALATVAVLGISVQHVNELERTSAQRIADLQAEAQKALLARNAEASKAERDLRAQYEARLAEQPLVLAVLTDKKSTPSLLVTTDKATGTLTLQRLTAYQEGDGKSLQLWALPSGGKPRSLGVLSADQVMRVAATDKDLQGIPAIAISLEIKGGVPSEGGPKGPVLFSGPVLNKVS